MCHNNRLIPSGVDRFVVVLALRGGRQVRVSDRLPHGAACAEMDRQVRLAAALARRAREARR